MNAIKIIEDLNAVFAPIDAHVLETSIKWADGRHEALYAFRNSEEGKEMQRKDLWGYYGKMYDIVGGKTWYKIFTGTNKQGRDEFMTKNCAAAVDKRNAKIAKKLAEQDITEVLESTLTRTTDGFHGVFAINTDKGKKLVRIETIIAGGYNIQRIHNRTLIKIK